MIEAQSARIALVPARPLEPLRGLRSVLRDYQVRGAEWLLYLHDNGFGGLLCDDRVWARRTRSRRSCWRCASSGR